MVQYSHVAIGVYFSWFKSDILDTAGGENVEANNLTLLPTCHIPKYLHTVMCEDI